MRVHPRGEVALTDDQLDTLAAVTRAASALSAVGVITIIATFSLSQHFRNPMHRLIFINAFYNAFDVVCTTISVSGYSGGNKSALCQFQGFLNQMFPVADVLWTLVMAVDVYLIVFRSYDMIALRRLEWKYMIGISIFTFIPALVMLFIDTEDKGPMYGGVTLWCSIAPKWVLFRIVLYYVPIWTSILIIIVLYTMVGIEIFRRRMALQQLTNHSIPFDDAVMPSADDFYPAENASQLPSRRASGDQSLLTTASASKYSPSIPQQELSSPPPDPPRGGGGRENNPSLSFRQYILMPIFFFLALLSVWVAPSTNRVAAFIDPAFGSYPLLLAVGISGSLRGFWNGLVFVTVGIKSWKREKREKEKAIVLRPITTDNNHTVGEAWS